MTYSLRKCAWMLGLAALLLSYPSGANAAQSVAVHLSTSLEGRPGRTPLWAVDGDLTSSYGTRQPPKKDDHFTITFDAPTQLSTVEVITGTGEGRGRLEDGALEASEDGTTFTELARLKDGTATSAAPESPVKAIRLHVLSDAKDGLILRELRSSEITFEPAGRVQAEQKLGAEFGEETIRFLGDASLLTGAAQAKLTAFLRTAATIYTTKLGEMVKRLDTPWAAVPKSLLVIYKADTGRGVPAYALGNTITLNITHVLNNPADSTGMFTHELSHVVQQYRGGNPGWLVEGIADLIRYELSEPGDAWLLRVQAIDPKQSDYKHAYGEAAKFLAWVQKTHAPGLESKLSRAMHDGKFHDGLWVEITGKDLASLWAEYQGD